MGKIYGGMTAVDTNIADDGTTMSNARQDAAEKPPQADCSGLPSYERAEVFFHERGQAPQQVEPDSDFMRDAALALSALRVLDPDSSRERWLKVGRAIHSISPNLRSLWDRWSQSSEDFDSQEIVRIWTSFADSERVSIDELIELADETEIAWRPDPKHPDRLQPSQFHDPWAHSVDSVDSVYAFQKCDPTNLMTPGSVPVFPLELIPEPFREFLKQVGTFTQTPIDLAAGMFLAVLGITLQGKFVVQVRRGWHEPLNLYVMAVLDSANRKSAVLSKLAAPLRQFEAEELERFAPQIRMAKAESELKSRERSRLLESAARARGERREALLGEIRELDDDAASNAMLHEPRLLADNITPEFLAARMSQNGGRMGVLTCEGDLFDLMAGRGSNGSQNFGIFLKAHCGDELRIDRGKRSSELIRNPTLTLGFCVQPDVLHGLIQKKSFRERGLVGRILFQVPESLLGRRKIEAAEVDSDIETAYAQSIRQLLGIAPQFQQNGQSQPFVLTLSTEAAAELSQFMQEVEESLGEFGDLALVSDWAGKLVGAVVRIAGLLHGAALGERSASALEIDASTMRDAICIGRYFRAHALKAFDMMGRDESVELAERLMKLIVANQWKEFSKRDVYQHLRRRLKNPDELDAPLKRLADQGYIRRKELKKLPTGRTPSPRYIVNPAATAATAGYRASMSAATGGLCASMSAATGGLCASMSAATGGLCASMSGSK